MGNQENEKRALHIDSTLCHITSQKCLKGRQNAPRHIRHFETYTWNKQEAANDTVLHDSLCTDIFFNYFQSFPSFDLNASEKKWILPDPDFSGAFFLPICTRCNSLLQNKHFSQTEILSASVSHRKSSLGDLQHQDISNSLIKHHKFCNQIAMQKLHYYTIA